jgi:hypothetical protein
LLLIFGPHTKKKKIQKIKNKFRRKQKNNVSEKRIPKHSENGQKLVEEVQKYKD